jgi:hypothetical protein
MNEIIAAEREPPTDNVVADAVYNSLNMRLAMLVPPILSHTATSRIGLAIQTRAATMACAELWESEKATGELDAERPFIEAMCRHTGVTPIYYLDGADATATSEADTAEVVANIDPVFAAISAFEKASDAHRRACGEYSKAEEEFLDTYGTLSPNTTRQIADHKKNVKPKARAVARACNAEHDAFYELMNTVPTTPPGLSAMVTFLSGHRAAKEKMESGAAIDEFLSTLVSATAKLPVTAA